MELVSLLAAVDSGAGWIGDWAPGIGDPTFLGWFTVVAYAAATFLCYRLRGRFSPDADSLRRKERFYWGGMTLLLLFLCINKQLDLQTAMTEFFRGVAKRDGWYAIRYEFQVTFIAAMAMGLFVAAAVFWVMARRLPVSARRAGLGLIIVAVFVLIRAASFHKIDRLLGERVLHFKLNWVLELGGIAVVIHGGRRRWKELNLGPHHK
jgi:hypothetical protein